MEVPLPSFWGGYKVKFDTVEFWQGRENRLHDRFIYKLGEDGSWDTPKKLLLNSAIKKLVILV